MAKLRRGRPPKGTEARDLLFSFRLTRIELTKLRGLAKLHNKPPSSYAREKALA
jgi:hypothetical protein